MTNRIETLSTDSQLEIMAPGVDINWNPITNTGPISFSMARYLVENGVIRPDIHPSPAGMLSVHLEDIIYRCFAPSNPGDTIVDPVTGADLTHISVAGVMTIIKAAFDTLYTEKFPPVPSPTPTPTPTPDTTPSSTPAPTLDPTPTPSATPQPSSVT